MVDNFTLETIISDTGSLIKRSYGPLLAAGLLAILIPQIILLFVDAFISQELWNFSIYLEGAILFTTVLFSVLLSLWLSAGAYKVLIDEKFPLDLSKIFSNSSKYFWKYLLLSLIAIFAVVAVALLFVLALVVTYSLNLVAFFLTLFVVFLLWIPLIFVYIRLLFSPLALVGQDLGVIEAIRSSWELTRGRFWKTFAYLLLFNFVSLACIFIFLIPAIVGFVVGVGFWTQVLLTDGVGALVGLLIFPIQISYMVAIYKNFRSSTDKVAVVGISQPTKPTKKPSKAKSASKKTSKSKK